MRHKIAFVVSEKLLSIKYLSRFCTLMNFHCVSFIYKIENNDKNKNIKWR